MKHMLDRTSPMGQKFFGTCRLCGKENLPAAAALDDCDNPRGVSFEEGFMDMIRRDKDESNDQTDH